MCKQVQPPCLDLDGHLHVPQSVHPSHSRRACVSLASPPVLPLLLALMHCASVNEVWSAETAIRLSSTLLLPSPPGTSQSTERAREGTTQQNLPKGARIKPMGPIDLTPPGVPAPYSRQDRVAAGGCFWIMTEQTDFMLFSLARVINPQKQPSAGVEKKDRKTCAVLVEAVPRFKVLPLFAFEGKHFPEDVKTWARDGHDIKPQSKRRVLGICIFIMTLDTKVP
ncbi:hypothetical protein CCHR01_15219 [Colletotrichum chrysophilum]|uniref:Uncharacterized protein n=1 Tax=Colletotrichum chrysophilum TaxID=1836956 RepID=A0AAD9A834_9PEZI|nr:hypothetical protein CCHR01_15219 [Colletotrichum chrysophilum]